MDLEKQAEHGTVDKVGADGYRWSLHAIVEGEQTRWLKHGPARGSGTV